VQIGDSKTAITRERLCGHVSSATTEHAIMEETFPVRSVPRLYKETSCYYGTGGGGVEYLHRDPASRMRRQKGKSRVWDSKIWSRVPRDSNPRKTALARTSSIYKWQTRPLVREGAPQKEDGNCQTAKKIWSWAPDGGSTPRLTDWLAVSRNVTLTLTYGTEISLYVVELSVSLCFVKMYNMLYPLL
jgi:hypothetical protein